MSYTYALLDVSSTAYAEIREKLKAAGYDHAFHRDGDREVIDMSGIALRDEAQNEEDRRMPITRERMSDALLAVRNALIAELGAMYDDELGDSSNPDYLGPTQVGIMAQAVADAIFRSA